MVTGYDHLLFLFGVVFFLTRFSDIVRFITAFSIGHSITLVFATLYSIQANYYLVDAVIALTVCYKAFDNLGGFKTYLKMKSPNLMWMVLFTGLDCRRDCSNYLWQKMVWFFASWLSMLA